MRYNIWVAFGSPIAATTRRKRDGLPLHFQVHGRITQRKELVAWNVSRLAQLADVSRPTIEKMENDEPVRADLASAVCRVLSERLGYEVTIEDAEIKVL